MLELREQNKVFLNVHTAEYCHNVPQDFWAIKQVLRMGLTCSSVRNPLSGKLQAKRCCKYGRRSELLFSFSSCQLQAAKPSKQLLQTSSKPAFPPLLGWCIWEYTPSSLVWALGSVILKALQCGCFHLLNPHAALELPLLAWGKSGFYSQCFPFVGVSSAAGTAQGARENHAWLVYETSLHPDEMCSVTVGSHIIFMLSSVSLSVNML